MHVKLDEINLFHKKILIDFDSNNKQIIRMLTMLYYQFITK